MDKATYHADREASAGRLNGVQEVIINKRLSHGSPRRWGNIRLAVLLALAIALPRGDASLPYVTEDCVRGDLDGHSVARVWDEQLLDLIRQVIPAPTVHARNLFHLSAAMWDAWAAYDPDADGYFITEKVEASNRELDLELVGGRVARVIDPKERARDAAISFAAYRILLWRYARITDLETAEEQLDATMASLCYRTDYTTTDGNSAGALGNRIAAAVIAYGEDDGALEAERYVDAAYRPVNDPLEVATSGTTMRDPNHWQPLALGEQISQNGIPIPGTTQTFIGPHWGHVKAFALAPSEAGTPIDPGAPPRLGDAATDSAFKDAAVQIIRYSSELDAADGVTIDIGPGALGDNSLGTNDGRGHDLNPATGQPYAPDPVARADFARVLAEYWADGPKSETPPGHWNTIANAASDSPGVKFQIGGEGPELNRLEWDVKLYFALNGAVHDAAIAAWGLKGFYDSVRPISMIRYMGGKGQSTDPNGPAYDPAGLPLVPDLVEVISAESSAAGEHHEHLAAHVGEIAIRSWLGFPKDPETQTSGVGWIRAVDWVPYQRSTFVTPAFAGYVSGHSTFSRAAAEVMTSFTGDPFFPGGLSEWTVEPGELLHEKGPSAEVTLQWATYFDAADQAGMSRLFMGIHISQDDLEGRRIGSICGKDALKLALRYFDGSARS